MVGRDSLTAAKTELVMAVNTSGGNLEAAMATVTVSAAAAATAREMSDRLLPSDKTIASSKFSGFGGSVV